MNGYDVKVATFDGKIVTDVDSITNDISTNLIRQIADITEHKNRQALIDLGWSPPGERIAAINIPMGSPNFGCRRVTASDVQKMETQLAAIRAVLNS